MQTNSQKMKDKPTMAQILGLFSVVIIPLLVWGISVETRFTEVLIRVQQNEKFNHITSQKLDKIQNTTNEILINLERKQDRIKD